MYGRGVLVHFGGVRQGPRRGVFSMARFGKVYLVGAGPGDPGLITVRGRECLALAGAVVHDALANPALLLLAPGAELIDVGKRPGRHRLRQEDINRILVAQAARHGCVVRLKGGDPFVFGRGGEEALALRAAGAPFEVVPGVSAGVAAPAYAGIPVTHRGLAGSVTFVTGHLPPGAPGGLDYSDLPRSGTLVFFMAAANLEAIAAALQARGRSPGEAAAVISWGTCARQRTAAGTLGDIASRAAEAGIGAPAVLVVGPVAALREELAWFEDRPLFGLRVAVTHAPERAGRLEGELRGLGAEVFPFPTVAFTPAAAPAALNPADYDWIVLTSANAVDMLLQLLAGAGRDVRALAGARLCAVSAPSVLEALGQRALAPDASPEGFGAGAIVEALQSVTPSLAGLRVLVPRADIARGSLPDALRAAGARVEEVAAYHAAPPPGAAEGAAGLLAFGPRLVTFTNSEAARNFCRILDEEQRAALARDCAWAALGPVTAEALRASGLAPAVVPARPSLPDFVEAITGWWRAQGAG